MRVCIGRGLCGCRWRRVRAESRSEMPSFGLRSMRSRNLPGTNTDEHGHGARRRWIAILHLGRRFVSNWSACSNWLSFGREHLRIVRQPLPISAVAAVGFGKGLSWYDEVEFRVLKGANGIWWR